MRFQRTYKISLRSHKRCMTNIHIFIYIDTTTIFQSNTNKPQNLQLNFAPLHLTVLNRQLYNSNSYNKRKTFDTKQSIPIRNTTSDIMQFNLYSNSNIITSGVEHTKRSRVADKFAKSQYALYTRPSHTRNTYNRWIPTVVSSEEPPGF